MNNLFLVIGIYAEQPEVKSELRTGELKQPRATVKAVKAV